MARPTLRPHGRGTKLVALLCSSLLACTTVRSHVSTIAPEVMLREGHATIQLDLWVESNRPLTPEGRSATAARRGRRSSRRSPDGRRRTAAARSSCGRSA